MSRWGGWVNFKLKGFYVRSCFKWEGKKQWMKMKQKKISLSTQKKILACPVCSGNMKKMKDSIKQDGVDFDAFRCSKCGEEIMTMSQLKVLAGKYRELRKSKDITFSKWVNSLAVRIPSDIADEFQLSAGKHGILTKDKDGIRIRPIG